MTTPPPERKLLVEETIAAIKRLANAPHDQGTQVAQDIQAQVRDIERLAGNQVVSERCRSLLAAVEDVYIVPVADTQRYILIRSNRRAKLYGAIQELEAALRGVGLLGV